MRITKPLTTKFKNHFTRFNCKFQQAIKSLGKPTSRIDYGSYGHLIQHFTDRNLPLQAKQLHARVFAFSGTPDNFLASKLIGFYSKIDGLSEAYHLFDRIPQKNTFAFNAMLIAYTAHHMYAETLRLFSSWTSLCSGDFSVRPDYYTITSVLKALSGLFCDLRLAKEVHGFVLLNGLADDVFVGNGLITYYAECEGVGLARRVFDKMPVKDVVSWNSLISGYSHGGFYEECKTLFREMLDSSELTPNGVTLLGVLQACGQSGDLALGMEVHRFAVENHIEMDVSVCNALISLYAKCGNFSCARDIFEGMTEKDEVTYGSLISGYMLHGFVEEAVALFQEIEHPPLNVWNGLISGLFQNNLHDEILRVVQKMQACGVRPNAVTLSSVLPTLAHFSNLRGVKATHGYAVTKNYKDNIYVAAALVDTYAKTGFLQSAKQVFDRSRHRSLVVWTAIIAAFAAHGDAIAVISYFDEMLHNNIQPDAVTLTAVLSGCAHSAMVDRAETIFNSMFTEYGIEPSVEHYACVVGALSRAGKLSEATEFISKMPMEPSAKVWGALLNGASVFGDVELGQFICDRLFEIEPENTGNYIIMANLYSRAGKWKEADMVRDKMRTTGLRKVPGSSWIETSRGLKHFIARDTSSERTEEIYKVLEELLILMREEVYVSQVEFDEEFLCLSATPLSEWKM